jgi:hypothetical protein
MEDWSILRLFGRFCDHMYDKCYGHLVYLSRFGMLYQEKSRVTVLQTRSSA